MLAGLQVGPFEEAATLLKRAVATGARVRVPEEVVSSAELRNTYQVRRRHIVASGIVIPGFELTADLFERVLDGRWLLVAIEGIDCSGTVVVGVEDEQA